MRRLIAAALAATLTLVPIGEAFAQQGAPFIPADSYSKRRGVEANATGTTGAVVATIPAVQGATAYICGGMVSPGSATAPITNTITIAGIATTLVINDTAPATAAGTTGANVPLNWTPCEPASAANTPITVTQSALGAGGVGVEVNVWGYYVDGP